MRSKLFQIFLILLLLGGIQYALPQNNNFQRITTADGLSHNSITCMMQDREGYLWFGTEDGLNKYDGYSFSVYRHDIWKKNSLLDNYIWKIIQDQTGHIWIATSGGLDRFDPHEEKFSHYLYNPPEQNNIVSGLAEDKSGKLWAATARGILLFDKKKHRFELSQKYYLPAASKAPAKLYRDRYGNIWAGAPDCIAVFRNTGDGWQTVSTGQVLHGKFTVSDFAEDREGHLLVSTSGGCVYAAIDDHGLPVCSRPAKTILSGSISSVAFDSRNNCWAGTTGKGLRFFNRELSRSFYYKYSAGASNSLSDDFITCLCMDKTDQIWIGTRGGLSKLDSRIFRWKLYTRERSTRNTLSDPYATSVVRTGDGRLFIGTYNGGLNEYDPDAGKWIHYRSGKNGRLPSDFVHRLYLDGSSRLWISTNKGLVLYDLAGRRWTVYTHKPNDANSLSGNDVREVRTAPDGKLWIATFGSGLSIFDQLNGKWETINSRYSKIGSTLIRSICFSRNGDAWLATDEGLSRFRKTDNKWIVYRNNPDNNNSLCSNSILVVREDNKGLIWAGTRMGLSCFNPRNGRWKSYTVHDGLPNDFVNQIVVDKNNILWLSTNNGLSRFDPVSEKFRNFDVHDGLQGNEFSGGGFYDMYSDEIYFTGPNGVNAFSPAAINEKSYRPPVVVTSFKVFNKPFNYDRNKKFIELSYDQNFFSFEFASLDYSDSRKNRYAYRLDGYDNEWVYCGTRRYASYTNLNGGDYIFRIKGSNSDGLWNNTETVVRIHIIPPYWRTWWFRMAAAFILVGSLLVFYIQRISKLKNEKLKQQEFSQILIERQEKERKRIAAELHDSLGQELLIIKNYAAMTSKLLENSGTVTDGINHNISEISGMASEAIEEVRKISRNLRPFQIDRLGLTKAIESMLDNISETTGLGIEHSVDNIDNFVLTEHEIHIYRIVQETMNNIIKHSGSSDARLYIYSEENSIYMVIRDSGRGFDSSRYDKQGERKSGFGLSGIQERVNILCGKMNIISAAGKGTTVKISFPANSKKQTDGVV